MNSNQKYMFIQIGYINNTQVYMHYTQIIVIAVGD